MGYRIGIDTGGTFTDAVLLDEGQNVLATAKRLTRHDDLTVGLAEALDAILRAAPAGVEPGAVTLVSLSTTLATNALVEGRGRPVGLVLIGLDERRLGRARLDEALGGDPCIAIAGGHGAGGEPIAPLDEAALSRFVDAVRGEVDAWAISALFATRNPAHELRARALIESLDARPSSLGHMLSAGLDAPRRALTALLNARLVPLIDELIGAARQLLATRGIHAPLMVVKGDGSLLDAAVAARCPVETILSGPAASLVGARALYEGSGREPGGGACDAPELLVADTGGTTTDIGRLSAGEPRLASDGASVGGWRTMVRAVDVRTVALGGDGELSLGADGFRLGARRVVPLSLLAMRERGVVTVLEEQLRETRSHPHDGRFALIERRPSEAVLGRLSRTERALFERLEDGPLALGTLFAERSRERALERLEQVGAVRLAAFTPTDVSHLLGRQSDWAPRAAELGALLLMRRAGGTGGHCRWASPQAFASDAARHVAGRLALAFADAAMTSDTPPAPPLSESQRALVERGFESATSEGSLRVRLSLDMPLVGLGGPAESYHGAAATLLGTHALLPRHGAVANALGAVVGLVRQEVRVTLVDAGGHAVRVLLASGPRICDDVEEGVRLAEHEARERAAALATAAGVGAMTFVTRREDDIVERDGARTFLESRVTVIATGRPAGGTRRPEDSAGAATLS